MMRIFIPTRGRVGQQQTIKSIPKEMHPRVFLVAPGHETEMHRQNHSTINIMTQPDLDMSISEKRAWIMSAAEALGYEKILMLDDDLFFYVRREDNPERLRDAAAADVIKWFGELEARLSPDLPHAGFGPRQGNHTFPTGWHLGRMMLALGYYVPTVNKIVKHGRVRFREDMDICLQLLRAGYPNAVNHEFAVGQKAYAAPGGCTDERTVQKSDEDAELLAQLHPGFVRVVPREYRGVPRKEVVVQWKKAFGEGWALRSQDRAGNHEDRASGGNPARDDSPPSAS